MNGRVHWAGTEIATLTNGGIDGAIRSGEQAAQEIVIAENRRPARDQLVGDNCPSRLRQ
jgi:hypothetical protein